MARIGLLVLAMGIALTAMAQSQVGGGQGSFIVGGGVSLSWTSPGDGGTNATVAVYDLRYSTSIITDVNFPLATPAKEFPSPAIPGVKQGCFVSDLVPGTLYYFAIKSMDRAGNWSALSNVVAKIPQQYIVGDVNSDSHINISDAISLLDYIFKNGSSPLPWGAGDADCDGSVSISDVIYLIRSIFQNGPAPGSNCP